MNNLQNFTQFIFAKAPETALAISMTLFLLAFVFLFTWITGTSA
jgi:hypothetical protein